MTVTVSSLGTVTSEPHVFSETAQRQVDHVTRYLARMVAEAGCLDEESWQQVAEMGKSQGIPAPVVDQAVANAQEEQRRVQLFAVGKLP